MAFSINCWMDWSIKCQKMAINFLKPKLISSNCSFFWPPVQNSYNIWFEELEPETFFAKKRYIKLWIHEKNCPHLTWIYWWSYAPFYRRPHITKTRVQPSALSFCFCLFGVGLHLRFAGLFFYVLLSTLCSPNEAFAIKKQPLAASWRQCLQWQGLKYRGIGHIKLEWKRGKKQELSRLGLWWLSTLPRDLRGDYDVPLEVANNIISSRNGPSHSSPFLWHCFQHFSTSWLGKMNIFLSQQQTNRVTKQLKLCKREKTT